MIPVPLRDYTYIQSMTPMTALPGSQPVLIEPDAYYEVSRLLALDDGRAANLPGSAFAVQVFENENTTWFSDFVQTDLLFWAGPNPGQLLTPIVLAPNTALRVQSRAIGLTGVYTRLDLALKGVKRHSMTPQQYAQLRQRPYFAYVTPPAQNILAGGSLSLQIQVAGDAAFVVQNMLGVGIFNNVGGSSAEWAGVRVQITNISDSNRTYYANPVGWFQAFGQRDVWMGGNKLLSPMVFRKRDLIQVDITTDTAEATPGDWRNIQVAFEGYKVKG